MHPSTSVSVPEGVLFRDLGEEAVLLELKTGQYYSLNEMGTRMWRLLALHGSIAPVVVELNEEYEVPEEQLRKDVEGFIDILASRGLLALS
jgi:Coenzyme PQQ synthesis protein D (PqqD)